MEISSRPREEDAAYHSFNDMIPRILEEKIKTCLRDYCDKKNGKLPNVIILSDKARAALRNVGLLSHFYSISEGKRRVTLSEDGITMEIYHIDELTEKKRLEIKNNFSNNSEFIYLGRTGLLGKLKENSLKEYEFKCSF